MSNKQVFTESRRIETLCLIGVGMIGGSIALDLKQKGLVKRVIGVDTSSDNLDTALERGIIDCTEPSVTTAVGEADLILLSTPIHAIQPLFRQMRGYVKSDALMMDVASTKSSIVVSAEETLLPDELTRFVPCHPLSGREISGPAAARTDLFLGKKNIIVPHEAMDESAYESIAQLWQSLGATVETLQPDYHDEVLAATSHLPHFLAYILVDLLTDHPEIGNVFQYTGGGFKDFSRTASSDPTMWTDVSIDNKASLTKWMRHFIQHMERYIKLIEDDAADEIHKRLSRVKKSRDSNILK